MKTLIIVCLSLCLMFSVVHSQEESVDFFKLVELITQDPSGDFYLEDLQSQFRENPIKAGVETYRLMYYGKVFQTGFEKMKINGDQENFEKLFFKGKIESGLDYGMKAYEQDPVDLKTLYLLTASFSMLEMKDQEQYYGHQLGMLVEAILTSGNGKEVDNPFLVVTVGDQYVMKGILGFDSMKRSSSFDDFYIYDVWGEGDDLLVFALYR